MEVSNMGENELKEVLKAHGQDHILRLIRSWMKQGSRSWRRR